VSKNINVNPDHYKVAGRDRPDERIARKPRYKKVADNAHQDAMREKMMARQRGTTK
jgi:hypothetical protein